MTFKMKFIGITGGVGAGKTEILNYIRKHYRCEIYLADQVAKQLQEPGTACYEKLVALLGRDIVGADGEIDRGRMAEKIFSDAELLGQVNDIVHPAVKEFLAQRYSDAARSGKVELFFVEAALLIETGYGELVDEMWYVHADREVRRQRLMSQRGYSGEKVDRIMASQLDEDEFYKGSDFVIDNSGSLTESFRQVDRKLEGFKWQE